MMMAKDGKADGGVAPLAARLRPGAADELLGQAHLLGDGMPLAQMLDGRMPLVSVLLWGPPGSGKTSLARLLMARSGRPGFELSAVSCGLARVREVLARAAEEPAALFLDEIHRFNKAQQDALLPEVESGRLLLLGATTENPSFEVNGALLSRVQVFELQGLDEDALGRLAERALQALGREMTAAERAAIVAAAGGDGRRLCALIESLPPGPVDDAALAALAARLPAMDKGGDRFYDLISALHKSVRGSDPDAALYWLARMLEGGVDPRYVSRRLMRMASEDIGLADPRALQLAVAADRAWRTLGSPEGDLALAQAAVYLAITSKSNAVYAADKAARRMARQRGDLEVPMHLRNAPTRLLAEHGRGAGYRYPHDEPGGHAAGVEYLPPPIADARFYKPTDRGLEQRIQRRLAELRAAARPAGG